MSEGVLRGAWRKMNLGAVDWVEITRGSTQGFPDCLTWIPLDMNMLRDVAVPTELKVGSLTFTGRLKARVRAVQVGWHLAAWQRGRVSAVVVSVPKPLGSAVRRPRMGRGGQGDGSPGRSCRVGAGNLETALETHPSGPAPTSQDSQGFRAAAQEVCADALNDEQDHASHDDQGHVGDQRWRAAYGRVAVMPGFKIACLHDGIQLSDPSISILEVRPCRDIIARIMREYLGLAAIK